METRIAIIAIMVEKSESAAHVNDILHEYAGYIVGRMGLPHKERKMSIISIVIDAPHNTISALSGKLGRIDGVNSQTLYSKQGGA
ncbi:MAG: iron-only hydrogenase system regulator [Defluviitaleaceae bacterium]|nr:iron-only hydrogenase system regulator [Defluviitaleaceae bacterium]